MAAASEVFAHGAASGDPLADRVVMGRTRTQPGPGAGHLRFAMVSCAKYNAGYFNAYG